MAPKRVKKSFMLQQIKELLLACISQTRLKSVLSSMATKKESSVVCEKCSGTGLQDENTLCPACNGLGKV